MKTQPIQRTSLSEEVYQRLQQQIITLTLAPGQKLNDQQLAETFGVSRTPVREALKKLEEEGLVVTKRGSRTNVTMLDATQARQTFPIVATLHALAARLAFPLSEADITRLIELNQAFQDAIMHEDAETALQLDDAFHGLFLKRSQNGQLADTLNRLTPLIRRLEYAQFSRHGHDSVTDHRTIIEACQNGRIEDLVRATEHNWNGLGRHLIASLEEDTPCDPS
ncbi:transcriptional regulator, GntR family [Exiguobacterium sibiricum 255-15]|uniref:Transcriptional regulator, GntR family n=1 Tax=Exiguobacterium sibiricum (strain DSM 17290 / CCUG 55495 / CIP 109462 / JCM 13490 / 255-15) TaxID=262543 RepID=B1YFT6_EXIS2|nr:GntR family transcriptional regulator [Exiguobacterium sibiricum]ACB60863.1 transcriptional regulator, GntR family [Exiguobacterium sibiricum 255-15]